MLTHGHQVWGSFNCPEHSRLSIGRRIRGELEQPTLRRAPVHCARSAIQPLTCSRAPGKVGSHMILWSETGPASLVGGDPA